jgi:hypothetical protein
MPRALSIICLFLFGLSSVSLANERAPSIGARVLAENGAPVGSVSGFIRDAKGHVYRIRIMTSAPLGFGERMITVREGAFFMEGDAVRLRLTVPEVNALPTIMTSDDQRERESRRTDE